MSSSKLEFLDTLPIFTFLTQEELEALAAVSNEYQFDEGAVLAYQRDVADSLYIVREGRLYARGVDEQGIVRESEGFTEGEYFGDEWLFTPRAHAATIRATDAGRVIIIKSDNFLDFLDRHPKALDHLEPEYDEEGQHVAGLSPQAWAEAEKTIVAPSKPAVRAADLRLEELIEYVTRRSRWLLVLRLVPLIFLFLVWLFAFFYLARGIPLLASPPVRSGVVGISFLFFTATAILQWLDWRNDYFVITNRHIIHYEFNLSLREFGTVVKRTPIEQVQSVEIEKPNLFSNLLNVGTARVTTAAQSAIIYFDYIDEPDVVRDTIVDIQERVRQLDAGREQALMRQSLEEHFEAGTPYREVEEEGGLPPVRPDSLWSRLRRRYGSRIVDGDVITYRKHLFVLVNAVRWPMLSGSVVFLLFAALLYFAVTSVALWLLVGMFGLGTVAGLIWQVEDWRNELYQVTHRYVIDVDRSPFGTGESRKQAELSNVQNINSDRPGLLPTLFNYGNVYIETAGASADITFENVANPNQVQRDIFHRREQFRRRQRLREGAQRRKEYAVMLDVYKQALEQDRIPRRTPPSDAEGSDQTLDLG